MALLYAVCSLSLCLLDNGATVDEESMERHLAPGKSLVTTKLGFHGPHYSPIIGDIILVNFSDDVPKHRLAMLKSGVSRVGKRNLFARWISESRNANIRGYLIVERPVPDPDTRFESIANNPLLAAITTGLRSVADPSLLVPSPIKGHTARKCVDIIPVST